MTLRGSSSINFGYVSRANASPDNPRDIFRRGRDVKVICRVRSSLPLPNRKKSRYVSGCIARRFGSRLFLRSKIIRDDDDTDGSRLGKVAPRSKKCTVNIRGSAVFINSNPNVGHARAMNIIIIICGEKFVEKESAAFRRRRNFGRDRWNGWNKYRVKENLWTRRCNFLRLVLISRIDRDFYVRARRRFREKDLQNLRSNYSLHRWTSEVQTAVKLRLFNYSHACAFKSPLPPAVGTIVGEW